MVGGSARTSLGTFAIFFGIGLFILLRGKSNDTYAGILVLYIALLQLFDYGIWNDPDCVPGGSNDRGTRGLYIFLWLMPAVLCLAASFFATNLFADPASRYLLIGAAAGFGLLALVLATFMYEDKATWCTVPGKMWQPNYYFLHVPKNIMTPNFILLIGLLLPTIIVDPKMLGAGTIAIMLGSYVISRRFDPDKDGEWLSANTSFANLIAIWALLVPAIRHDLFGTDGTY